MSKEEQKIHPEYSEAYRLASEFWENPLVHKYWREPLKLIKAMRWEAIPYDYEEIQELSKEAYSTYRKYKFYIPYNINNHCGRITFGLHHETGHIVGGHPIRCGEILYKSCENSEKKYIEREATIIGRNIYLPAPIIDNLIKSFGSKNTIVYLQYAYYLSKEYAINRINVLDDDLEYMHFPFFSLQEEIIAERENMRLFLMVKTCKRFGGEYHLQKKVNPNVNSESISLLKDIMEIIKNKRHALNCG